MDLSACIHSSANSLTVDAKETSEQQQSLIHDVNCIRNLILTATHKEERTHQLEHFLTKSAMGLHRSIQLPNAGGISSLASFVTAYVENIPDFFELMLSTIFDAGLEKLFSPALKVAIDFFLTPRAEVFEECGLEDLLDQAFFAHRLFEEINDRYSLRAGIAIINVDMTTANLIMHSIIGDTFANKLDSAIAKSLEKTEDLDCYYDGSKFQHYLTEKESQWDSQWQSWQEFFCLSKTLDPIRVCF